MILHVYQKLWSDDVRFLRNGAQQMDGQTGRGIDRWTDGPRQKKWHIEVGAPPNSKQPRQAFLSKNNTPLIICK